MKIFGNIGAFCFIAKSIASLGEYKRKIDGFKAKGECDKERQAIAEVCDYWSNRVVDYLKLNINVINPENLPKEGPVVYVANHQSYADILIFLNTIKHQVGFIAKEELTKVPLLRDWILRIGSLFIIRGDARASLTTINEGAEKIKNGYSLVIFPEGTRSQGKEMAAFKPGSLKLATKAKATIVPVTINNSYSVFEEKGVIAKNKTADIMFHKPIDTSELDRKELASLGDEVEETIRQGLEALKSAK